MTEEPDKAATPAEDPEVHLGCGAAVCGLPLRTWDTIAIALLTVVADICLYSKPGGTGLAVLLLVTAVGLLSAAATCRCHAGPGLLVTVVLVAAASAWNYSWLLAFVGCLAVVSFAVRLRRPRETVSWLMLLVPATALLAPLRLLGHVLRVFGYGVQRKTGKIKPRARTPWRVVLVPLVVAILFIVIFVRANPVVEQVADDVSEWLATQFKEFWELFGVARAFFWLGFLLVFAALIRPVVRPVRGEEARRSEHLEGPQGGDEKNGDYATALVTLLVVNVLFVAFHGVDAVYLYFKAKLPEGISYSEYSRGGCFWLTMGLLLSTAVIGAVFRRRLNFHPRRQGLRILSYVWAVQNVWLAVGALRRLQFYVDYNGLTRLRIVGLYGTLLVVVGLALMVWKVARIKGLVWLIRRDLLAFWVALVLLALTPRDYICWRHNASQAMTGNLRPLAGLIVQPMSPEALPPLIPLLDHKDPRVRDGIAGLLGRRLQELRASAPEKWTAWQGAHAWAFRKLAAVSDRLDTADRPGVHGRAEKALREHVRPWVHTRSLPGSYD